MFRLDDPKICKQNYARISSERKWMKQEMQDNTKPCVDIRYLLLAPSGVMLPGYFNFTVYVLHEHLLRQKLATRRLWILFHLADAEWIHRPHVMSLHAVSRKMRSQQTGDCRVIVGTGQRPHCSIIANMQILIIFRGVPPTFWHRFCSGMHPICCSGIRQKRHC